MNQTFKLLRIQNRSFGVRSIVSQKQQQTEEKTKKTENKENLFNSFAQKIQSLLSSKNISDAQKKTQEEFNKFSSQGQKVREEFSQKIEGTPLGKITETIKEAADEFVVSSKRSVSIYGGFSKAETRRLERQRREKLFHEFKEKQKKQEEEYQADPNAGTRIVLHKDSEWKERWNNFKEKNPILQGLFGLKRSYEESDSLVAHYLHRIQDSIASIFEENEHARALKEIKRAAPDFNEEEFLKEMHDYIIPEVIEAFLHGNKKALRSWCTDGAYNVLMATIEEREKAGQHIDSKILDLRDVDIAMGRIFDERAVLIVTFNTQQVTVIRDNHGKIIEGNEEEIENVFYVMAVMREPESNPITGGWKVVEMGIQASTKTW